MIELYGKGYGDSLLNRNEMLMTADGKTGAHCYSGYSASRYSAGQPPHECVFF